MTDRTCDDIRELAPEVALGIASGDDRAAFLGHISSCDDCRAYVSRLSAIADDLLIAAPVHEAPAGFETRVLQRIESEQVGSPDRTTRRRPKRRLVLAGVAALVAAAIGAGGVWLATADDRTLANSYRETLATANGQYFSAADLVGEGGDHAGIVFAYQGDPSWMFVVLDDVERSGDYSVSVTTTSGRTVNVGRAAFGDERRGWGTDLTVDVHHVAAVHVESADETLVATLHHH